MTQRFFLLLAMIGLSLTACSMVHLPYRCTDPLGCLEIPHGGPVVLGTLLANSGDYASSGLDFYAASNWPFPETQESRDMQFFCTGRELIVQS